MRNYFFLICGLFFLFGFFAVPKIFADVAPVNRCPKPDLTEQQRFERSEYVFVGKVINSICASIRFPKTIDDFEPYAQCVDTLAVLKPIKGQLSKEFKFKHLVMVNPMLVGEKEDECRKMIADRNNKINGKVKTYYLRKRNKNLPGQVQEYYVADYFQITSSACEDFGPNIIKVDI